jgi:lysozyme family protein
MSDFDRAYDHLIGVEGGYVNDRDDRGKETYKGISRRFHPDWPGWGIIDKARHFLSFPGNLADNPELDRLTRSFYRLHYWDQFALDDLPYELAYEVFEMHVNVGGVVVSYLQRACNVLNYKGLFGEDLIVDGVWGNKTHDAVLSLVRAGKQDRLSKALNVLQGWHYFQIMERHSSQRKFAGGWLARVKVA